MNAQEPLTALDGQRFKQMIWASLVWLRQHQAMINALNVFPVPDGDTGTNMTLTMTSAWNEVADSNETSVGLLMSGVAHGALMGARGNSGVILSQIWRGFARSLDNKPLLHVSDFADAMQSAAETAYKGVVKPVEGTILTVVREAAEEAVHRASYTDDVAELLGQVVLRAKDSVARTPTLLPVLRQAGVTDSGGEGLVIILEGMWRELQGLSGEDAVAVAAEVSLQAEAEHIPPEDAYGYDVQFIIIGQGLNVESIRADIDAMGDSTLVVGDNQTIKVHVHVPDPGVPLSYAVQYGSLRDVVVEDMQAQYQEFIARQGAPALLGHETWAETEPQPIGIVAVVAGAGMERVFRSLGATYIIQGGQTMNPSTAQILEGVEKLRSEQVIILPNNKNVVLAAQQAAEVSEKPTVVVETKSLPQGIAALLAVDMQSSLDANAETMRQVADDVITAEVTWATRDVELNGVVVCEGNAIGLLNGQLVVATDAFDEVVHQLLEEADLSNKELVTLYYGEGVVAEQAHTLASELQEDYPDLEFEIIHGGQPHYPYLISIE